MAQQGTIMRPDAPTTVRDVIPGISTLTIAYAAIAPANTVLDIDGDGDAILLIRDDAPQSQIGALIQAALDRRRSD